MVQRRKLFPLLMNRAILLQRTSQDLNIDVSTYEIPDILQLMQEESLDIIRNESSSLSKSLPEAVGSVRFSTSPGESISILHSSLKTTRPLLNPLGAGDTCSGVFFLEFLDTHDAITAYRYGLAAASASCVMIDSTSHFSKTTMKIIFDQISVQTFRV